MAVNNHVNHNTPVGPKQNSGDTKSVQVIARAAQILRTLQKYPQGMTRSQLASEVSLARSTVHRIVNALIEENLVEMVSPNGMVRLGNGLLPLAAAVNSDIRRELRPYLAWLHSEVAETVDLACFVDNQVRFIDQIAAPHRLQAVSAIGVTFPLHCTANGKAFLATLLPTELDHHLSNELTSFTPQTITTRQHLLSELAQIRTHGIAYDREEHTVGICAVGAAIQMPRGELVAISIPVPSQRFYGNEEKLVAALLSVTRQIQQKMG
ncbi:MAG: IclR family transcriptional regulator [Chloroflexota bacterium]